jgi:hypothetical protein
MMVFRSKKVQKEAKNAMMTGFEPARPKAVDVG